MGDKWEQKDSMKSKGREKDRKYRNSDGNDSQLG